MISKNVILKSHNEIRDFIKANSGKLYNSVLITKKMYDEFNAVDFIDDFEVRTQEIRSGHGSSVCISFVSAPQVVKLTCGTETWYALHVGEAASTSLLREILKGYSEMLHENY